MAWNVVWLVLYRPSPVPLHGWRRFLLRTFGAKVGAGAHPYPSSRIWAPWNLVMGEHSCLSHQVDCYCVDKIELGAHATVSQYSFLCTATHEYRQRDMPLVTAPIHIGANAWVTADVFVGPGVTIGEGAVVGARSTLFRDVEAWTVVTGNPPKKIGNRDQTTIKKDMK
jgi:putative colanic acid biosynthesis acetyltransferase WcaF